MRKLPVFMLLLISIAATLSAAKDMLSIVDNGNCSYQIVIPDKYADEKIRTYIKQTADLLQMSIKESAGAELPIFEESHAPKDRPGIYLGDTAFAQANKIDVSVMQNWDCINIASGKNIILAGNDRPGVINSPSRHYTSYFLGTVKAVTTFIEQQLGGRFILPGPNGIEIPARSSKNLEVSASLNVKINPVLEYCTSRNAELFYDVANNFFGNAGYYVYGGHSYDVAVPRSKYAKSNPEYFAAGRGGERNINANHLCISNHDVQELMYAEILKRLDAGYKVVELGQTDGYIECQCDNCMKFFNVTDKGEKLWLYHKSLAERLLKDRPGSKVQILSYGPTINPPESFKDFPENVMIQLCSYSPESFAKWKDYKVPGGFVVYIYNWGDFQALGLAPKHSPAFCENQIRLFTGNNVKGIYRCGFGELYGLEGPQYYIFGQMLNHPDGSGEKFADDFYRAAYGNAYLPMKAFFNAMHERLEARDKSEFSKNPRIIIAYVFSPDVLDVMEQCLSRAEKTTTDPKVISRLKLVRQDFNYVKGLAKVIHLYNAYRMNKTWLNLDQLADAMKARKAEISSLYNENGSMKRFKDWPDIRPFNEVKRDFLEYNGRFHGAPFTWDMERLKKLNVLPGTDIKSMTVIKADSAVELDGDLCKGAWRNAEFHSVNEIQMGTLHKETKFKMLYDNDNLYVGVAAGINSGQKFIQMGKDGTCWRQDCIELVLDPHGNRENYYHFICNPIENSFYDAAVAFITDPLDPRFGKADKSWDGIWEYKNYIKDGVWTAIIKIPFKTLGVQTPQKGAMWCGNIGRVYYLNATNVENSLWSPNLETLSFHDRNTFGEFLFD